MLAHSLKNCRVRDFATMFNSLQLAICVAVILRPVSFARKISLEVSPIKCFVPFYRAGPRCKISVESFAKNYSYHRVTVS